MKKQIISVLLLISLSFQSTRSFPFVTPAQQKKQDSIPWWRLRAIAKALHESEKKLKLCGSQRCNQEQEEYEIATAKWRREGGSGLNMEAKYYAYQACLEQRCKQEYHNWKVLYEQNALGPFNYGLALLYFTMGIGILTGVGMVAHEIYGSE